MKKIPTLFKRDPENRSRVLSELAVELPPDARATAKFDGSCIMFDGWDWWKRREVKAGKPIPDQFEEVDHDPLTGKRQGWVPVSDGPEDQWFREAIEALEPFAQVTGTYEAVGPHFQGNPHGFETDRLILHGDFTLHHVPMEYARLAEHMRDSIAWEGIVWWADGQPVAKIKRRDFGLPWPIREADRG